MFSFSGAVGISGAVGRGTGTGRKMLLATCPLTALEITTSPAVGSARCRAPALKSTGQIVVAGREHLHIEDLALSVAV